MNFFIWIIMLVIGFFGLSVLKRSPPPVSVVEAPASVSSKVNMDSALVIAYDKDGYQLSYLNDKVITKSKAYVQSFIKKYKMLGSDKILVKGDSQAYKQLKEVKEAFKASGIYKFRIVTDGEPMP